MYEDDAGAKHFRHWLINASIGTTAEANRLFNDPDAILNLLKRRSADIGIVYAAARTIARYRPQLFRLTLNQNPPLDLLVKNLGIVKNPNFTGSLGYDSPYEPASGEFFIHHLGKTSALRLATTVIGLLNGRFMGRAGTNSWRARRLNVRAAVPFAVECDGEVVTTRVRGFTRSPLQMNQLHESDTELLRLPGTELVLAVTTDAIVEEIEQGLYEDPYQIGWMTITVSASDLAASAADPMGVLVTETLPSGGDSEFLNELQRGIRDACDFYSLPLLGGDTNFSSRVATCAVALGTVPSGSVLTRRGCRPNDLLFTSGPLGLGSSYALRKLAGDGHDPVPAAEFLPKARLAESRVLRRQASAAMDTSDGMIATVDQLMRLNNVGFEIELPVERFLHQGSAYMAECAEIPTWMMLAGPHGEFELLFTVPPQRSGDRHFTREGRLLPNRY
jgi:thiamine-monophosphate kinase